MYEQSGRYDQPLEATFKPPRGGLADKYRATRAPPRKNDTVADSDVSFGWIDDIDSGKSRKEDPSRSQTDLGKSRHGELSSWNGLEASSRGRGYDFEGSSPYDNNVVRAKPPSGNTRGHAGMARKPPTGPQKAQGDRFSESSRLTKEEPAQDRYSNPGNSWRTMALSNPGEDGMGWGTMFGRMQIRWSGREQRKQAMALATLARQKDTDGRGGTESNLSGNSKSGSLRPYRQRRKRFYTFILASVLLLVLAVAIVIPTVIFTRTDDKSVDEVLDSYVIYKFQAESPDLVFQADMNDPTSEIYINTAQEFCTGMESKMATNYSEQYTGCVVTGLQNGSVIFIFSLIFDDSPASPTTTQINLVIVGTSNPNETFQLGSFTITTGSLNLTSTSVSTTADFTDVNCLAPTPVENGNWSYSGSRFSDIAVLTCNTGYEIQGDANMTCTEQYQWSSRPNCTEVVCVNYTLPADSSIEPSTPYGITYNTNITVTCNPGFDITGDSIVSCMADGNWSTSPRCNIKSCPNFTKPDNSQLTPTTPSKVYNSFFIVTCDEGYVISGENNVTCLANGTWSARPSCNAIVCRNYTIPDNSSIEPLIISGHRYKTNITVTCNLGYGIDGEEIVMCMADGNWSGSPTCNIKSCPNYTTPENSRISPATPEITYGSGYIVMCDEGYESDGDTNVTCGADATWSTIPECQIIECPVFSNITHGYINTDNISYPRFNSTVNVTCDVGYSLSSNDTVRCRSNKTWSVIPSCDIVTCEKFIPPANSKLDDGKIPTNRTYNTVISVSCNTGYNITGDAEVTCMANGNWSATPRCDKIVCVEYIVPDNANIEPNTTSNQTFNTTLKVSCYVGYEIIGDSDVICEADGSWSKNPSCEIVVCYEFLTPENGMINPQNTTGLVFNSTIEVSCIDGYKLSEEDTVRCTASRNWSSLPRCEPIDCDAFIFPENSIHQNSSITSEGSIKYREELSVECVDGYILVGPKTFSCNATGQWPKITCNKVECNKTEIDKPFLFIVVEENDVYDMACDEGYNLKGNATVMCDQGNWTDIPDCEIVPCGPIVLNGNGTINANDTNYGDFAVLICDPGFEGDDQFVCQADGNWSGNPTCTPVICPPYNLPNGTVSSTVNEPYSFADVVMLSCQDGFDVVGGTMITCSEDKNWSDNTTCRAIECAETLSIENGNVIPNRTKILTFSESVMVECNVGFELNGSKEIVCQSSGKLSEKPKCDKVQCRNFRFPENSIEYMLNASFYGSNITLTCMDGYIVNGPPVSTCQANKTWTEIGECEPIPCDTVTLPEDMQTADSNKTISGKMFGEKVNIICVNNKLLTGEEQISCTKFGNWSINSKCVETDCDINTFNQPDHSKIIEANNTHLHLECNEGYKIVGEEIVICDNSRWSASPNCTIVSCGELEDPINGNINSTGVTYLENATLECIQGFTPKNSETFSCLATGNWSDIAECESVDCGNPDPPANAENISVADTKYGTREAYITCKEGFETESPVNVTCSEAGDWASVPPCDIVVCFENPTIENGKIEVGHISDREYGDTVFIKCNEGYEVETYSSVKCEANGSWSGLKNCSLVDCGVFNETLANGTVVNMTGSTFNERVDFECDPGFLLVGEDYITCQQNGSWGNPPVCEEIMCIDPNITYGTYRKYNGSRYEVECDDGFLLIGSNFIECQTNRSWDETPTCREIICMNYTEELLNGDIVEITGTRYGDTVTFVCDLGFNLNGPQSIVCDENGAWESKPTCEITDCGDPPVPVNGRLLADESTTFNTTLYAECDTGYSLDGTDETTCGESGNWSVLGVCELQDCGNVTVIGPYKELTYSDGTRYGSVVTIECAENYTLRSEDSAVCTQDWNVTFICSSTGNVSFDMAQYEFTVGDPGIIICSAEGAENWTNLFLSKSNSILVNINRTENTYINKTESARIRITDNTVISKNSATLEVEILSVACTDEDTYDCAIGVTLPSGDIDFNLGQATVEVIDTGTEVPTLRVSNTTYNTTAVVTCESLLGINTTGHPRGSLLLQARLKSDTDFNTLIPELENTTSEECNEKGFLQYSFLVNGSWDDAEVKCVIDTDNGTLESETIIIAITGVVCDGLPTVVFGSVINASTEDDQIFTVVCDEGHENVGDMNFTCTTLGWTGDPNCALLDCGQPVEFNNTVIEFTNETTTYNSIVFGFCKDDYNVEQIFDDKTYIVCGADGNWNISFTCKPVQCENVTAPIAGRIVSSNGTTVNSVLEIECDEGFNLVGNYSMAVCSSDGFWVRPGADNDSFIPRCTAIGELTFDFESNVTAVESNLTATCSLLNTPDWNRIGIFRQPEGEDISFVAVVDKSSDNSTANETVRGVEILSSSYFHHEEAVLKIQITNVTCDNDGEYFCGALKGNISVIADDNSLAIESYVTVTSEPDVPMLNIPQTSLEPGEEVEISCQGYVGQTSTRDNKAQLDLQIRYSDKSDFEIITKDIEPVVNKTGCLIQHTKRISFTVNSTYDGAVLRCVTDDGSSPLLSSNVTLTVAGELTFDFESNVTAVQSNLTATCTLLNTPDWNRIGIFRPTEGEDNDFVAFVDKLSDNSTDKETVPGVEILSGSYFYHDKAVLEIQITNVTCENDGVYVCGALKGNVSEITKNNSLTVETLITITSESEVPMLNVSKTSLEPGEEVDLSCQGYVGQTSTRESKAKIDLQIKYSGNTDFETITSSITPEVTQVGCAIEHIKRTTITVNSTYDGALLRCISDDGASVLFSDNFTLTVTGELTFDFESNVTAVQSNLTATCTLLNTPDWNRIGIFRPTEGEDNDFVAFVDKLSDNSTDKETVPGVEILSGSYFYHDKAVLEIQITNVTCENDGVYVCGALKGNVSEITKNNSLTVETLITITSESEVPMLNVSKTSLEPGEEVDLSCQGYVGQTSTRESKAKIDLQIKYSGNTDFETITSSITPEVTQVGCAIEHIKRTTITVNSTYDGALLRCISDDGASVLFSDNFTLTVTGELTFDFESNVTAVQSNLTATCTLLNTPDWNRIGIFRPTEGEDNDFVAFVDKLSDNSTDKETVPGVEILSGSYFYHDKAVLEIQITNVTCENDGVYVCGALKGNVSEITKNNSLTVETLITITSESEVPMLNVSKTSLEPDEEVELSCQGYVGQTSTRESKAKIDLQIKYSGSTDFETITSSITPEVTQVGCAIEHIKRTTITVNSTYDGALLRCISDDGASVLFSDNFTLTVTDLSGVTFELRAVAEDAEFIAEMNDPLSSVFIDFQSDFCNGYATRVGQSDLSEQYLDCRVVSLGEGSVIINFEIKFQGDSPPSASHVISTLTETANDTDTVQIGAYSITKSLVEVIVVTATKGSVTVLFTSDKSVFSIGEAGALNINIQGATAWKTVSISKTRDGVQTSIGNITESFANVQFFSNHLSLSSDSTSNETDANIIIDFEPVKCDDDGQYTVEVRMDDGQSVQVDKEITLEYTPRVDLTLPVEMREDRWTLNITCEAVFHSSVNRTLSWLRKGGGDTEFVEFSPEDIVEKPVEFRHNISMHTNYDCLWRVKEDFDLNTTSADTWNNTQFRCALDYGTPEQVLSEVGTILLVPRNVCAGLEAGENVQNPLECTKKVQCNAMSGDWGYVFATGCEEGTCWVGPGDSDCENISITTTTTTTTPVPGTPYIFCSDTMRSEKEGTIAFFPCELRNIDKIVTLNISLDDDPIYGDSDETNGISGVLSINDGITVVIDKDSLNVSIETSCKNEGLYQIEINNGTDAELSLALIADPETPEISLPSNIYQNQRTDMTCTGIVGRDKDGNNSADLSFEIRKADSDMFQVVDGAISRVNEENNCTITQKASLSAYFEKDFNKSAIRCVAKADAAVLSESALYNISLVDPSVSFLEANVSAFIGEPFSLECNVENVANLTKLELTKDGTSLAFRSLDGESSEADIKIVVALIEDGSGKLKVNFSISKCSDKGEYICEAITTAGVSHSTKASVLIQRKPELPQLYPSLQIIEGVSPWLIFPTQCYGEVGYPQGTVSLESNRDGNEFASIDDAEAMYTVDDEKCSSIGNINYYNTYTLDWDNTEMRCVTRNSLVGDGADFVTSVTKTINVIPASFCDGKEDDTVLHPYYCYGLLTCTGNEPPIPYHLCSGNNTQCYDESRRTCVDCESVDKCDVGSTPAPTLPPGTPIMNCTREVKGTKNSIVTINCELTNINVTLATLNSSNFVLTSNIDGNIFLDTVTASNFSTSESVYVYTEGPVTASIASSMIQIQMNLTECDIAGDYTVRYNGNSLVEDNINFVITADAVPPVLSQRPNVFYADQSATIQCTGNVGNPAGNLSLIYKTSESGEWLDDEVGTTEETEDEETCGIIVTKIRELDVTEDLDGYIYACETVTRDNQTYRSGQIQVSVQDPVLLFREAELTAAIGDPLALACTWNTTIINASANISRSAIGFDIEEILLIYEFGENVTSQKSGVNGNFQTGDEGRPNNLSLTFDEISCEDEAIYSCKLLVDDELVAEAKETIYVTSNHSTPTMTLPQQLVLDQPTLYNDLLKCNGSVGYPSDNSVLKLEYYSEDGQTVIEFDMGTLAENRTVTDDCMTEGELSYRAITFDSGWNGTIFRCALYDGADILDTSDNQTLLLFENNCDAENDGQYFQHPYDCHLHTRCYNNGTIVVASCAPVCPNFLNNNTLVTCDNACDDLNCPST